MAYPVVSPTTLRWYNALPEYLRAADELEPSGGGYPLLRFLSLFGDQLDEVMQIADRINYVAPDDGGDAGDTSDLVDARTADPSWLPWLAQLYGVDLANSATVKQQRDAITSAATGWQAGTKSSLAAAAASALTGQRFVEIIDHLSGNPWVIGVRTRTSETPNQQELLRALSFAKPAGFYIQLLSYSTSWDILEAALTKWSDWELLTWDQIENVGLGSQNDAVWATTKAQYLRGSDGGFATKNSNDDILSTAQATAMRLAVELGDSTTALALDNFAKGKLDRSNGTSSNLGASAGNGLHLMAQRATNNAGGAASVTNWDWQIGADINRAVAKIMGAHRFSINAGIPAFANWLSEATVIAQEILQYSTIKVGKKRYLSADSLGIGSGTLNTNGGAYPGGIIRHASGYADFAAFRLFAETDVVNRAEWLALIEGELDVLWQQLAPSSPLGSTPGLPAEWTSLKMDTLQIGAITNGVDGWTATLTTDMGELGFKLLHRLYWWWIWYSDARALDLFRTILPFFKTDYAASGNNSISSIYTHAGVRPGTIVELTYVNEALYLAAKSVNDTDFATLIRNNELTGLYFRDASGSYWTNQPGASTTSDYNSMLWNNIAEMADHGLWSNL